MLEGDFNAVEAMAEFGWSWERFIKAATELEAQGMLRRLDPNGICWEVLDKERIPPSRDLHRLRGAIHRPQNGGQK